MKKLILSAIALVSLTCHAVAQAPEGPSSTPMVTPPPVSTPTPVPTQPTQQKEKGEKHKGDHAKNKGEERPWENHGKKKKEAHKVKKEAQKVKKEAQKEQKVAQKEARPEKLDKMKAYLNLSDDQESRLSTAIQSFRTNAKAVKENTKLSAEQKKVQFDKLVAERNAQLKSILTPDQLAKLAEAQKQGQAQGKARNGFISDEIGDEDLF